MFGFKEKDSNLKIETQYIMRFLKQGLAGFINYIRVRLSEYLILKAIKL
jgi:hypothetical protein